MNQYRWCLLLAAIPILVAAQIVLRYQEAEVLQYLDRPDGSGAALLRNLSNGNREIIAWDAGLTNRRKIYSMTLSAGSLRQIGITSDAKGERIAFLHRQSMICIQADDGTPLWKSEPLALIGDATRTNFVNDGQHLVVSTRERHHAEGHMIVLETAAGNVVSSSKIEQVVRYLVKKNRLAIQYGRDHKRSGQWDVLQIDKDEASLVKSHPFVPSEMLSNGLQVDLDVTIQASFVRRASEARKLYSKHSPTVDLENRTWMVPATFVGKGKFQGKSLRVDSMAFSECVLLLLFVGLAAANWAIFLVRDGQRSDWQWRPVIDAVLLTVFLAVLCVQLGGTGWMSGQASSQPAFILRSAPIFFQSCLPSLLSALTLVAALGVLFWERRPAYVWAAVFTCCALPVLLPLVAICLIAMKAGYQLIDSGDKSESAALATIDDSEDDVVGPIAAEFQRRRLRFGISEMMLATAGLAIFFGIGQLGAFLIPVGMLLAGLVTLSVMLANKNLTSTVFFLSVFIVALLNAGNEIWSEMGTAVFSFAVPLFIAMAAMHGFRLAKNPVVTVD
ncbi:MAG: hypothetical protein WBD20_17520 [Pirellulaceae bacterium]